MTERYNITFKVCEVTTKDISKLETIVGMTEEVVRSIFAECDVNAVFSYECIYSDIEEVKE